MTFVLNYGKILQVIFMDKKTKILFGYRISNAECCTYGDDDGFLFEIYSDGTGIYNKYIVEDVIIKSR
ncbi:MAG: hypothetical protein K2J39_12695, partial [Ruminococcus sp.]|nr:hypothetical protein [Ruminococcus sp.]